MCRNINLPDLTNKRFGRLVALRCVGVVKRKRTWECQCDCGKLHITTGAELNRGGALSCGCSRNPHGHSQDSTYRSWVAMVQRCTNPNNKNYLDYGGRGIGLCAEWRDFRAFFSDMGTRPENMTIERIDNNKGYSPSNCKWATWAEQCRNKRSNKFYTYDGQTRTIAEWERFMDLPEGFFCKRLKKMTFEEAIKQPCHRRPPPKPPSALGKK